MKMDVGKDVRRQNKAVAKLADTVQAMMTKWTEDNFSNFQETMELIREGAPVQWVRLYMDAVKMGIIKETNININFNRQKDREGLQALVHARVTPRLSDKGEYTPYEEVRQPSAKLVDTSLLSKDD